ncbi:MAG TPA: hypothetical protein VFZ95_08690, partial [Steroidobacteraceae bacterium]
MNGTPGVIMVPGDTWTRPFGCSMVTGSMQIQEPSSFRQKAFLTSWTAMVPPSPAFTIGRSSAEFNRRCGLLRRDTRTD